MSYIIDRFEGAYAVCEDMESGERITLTRAALPVDAAEGAILIAADGGYIVDADATEARRARIRSRFERLKRKE